MVWTTPYFSPRSSIWRKNTSKIDFSSDCAPKRAFLHETLGFCVVSDDQCWVKEWDSGTTFVRVISHFRIYATTLPPTIPRKKPDRIGPKSATLLMDDPILDGGYRPFWSGQNYVQKGIRNDSARFSEHLHLIIWAPSSNMGASINRVALKRSGFEHLRLIWERPLIG